MPASRILIADDNQPNIELLEAYLAEVECEIATAADGHETLEKVAEFKPDLVLLDIMMPKLSGFDVCMMLKSDEATKQIMIFMVTALGEPGDIERAVAAGCNDFLSKPINKLDFLMRVENLLKVRHLTDERDRLLRYIDEMESGARRGNRDMPAPWSPDSSRAKPIEQAIEYPDAEALRGVLAELSRLPPLVTSWEVEALKEHLAAAARGERFLLQGGDCAESFDDCRAEIIASNLKVLLKMSLVLIYGCRKPVVRVGRVAGQYAKPRSSPTETRDGISLPSYRGPLINRSGFTAEDRRRGLPFFWKATTAPR